MNLRLSRRDRLPYNRGAVADRDRSIEPAATLARIVQRCADPAQRDWFVSALAAAREPSDVSPLLAAWGAAVRRLRATPAAITPEEAAVLEERGLRGAESWTLDRFARAALLCEAARGAGDPAAVVEALYRTSDNDERAALLGALAALPEGERFAETAVAACRTNVTSVFEAIACRNPYPAQYFSDEAFNQMVIKALFLGVSVERIENLRGRFNGELARMVTAYATERRAAGRSVPDDVAVILSLEAAAS
jgi:hypothetical protein